MKITDTHWKTIRELFKSAFNTTGHFSLATINPDGSPHITPIGSIVLRNDKTGFYCEGFPRNIPANLQLNPWICVMAVNAGKKRQGTEQELAQWQKRVRVFKTSKGYDLLWKDLYHVRDIYFEGFEPVHAGAMTWDLWN